MNFDLPKMLQAETEPESQTLKMHYRNLFPEYDWQPHGDYVNLAKEMCWFYDDVINGNVKRWLSATGQSGTGKTEWAKRIKAGLLAKGYRVQMWNWTHVCEKYLNNGDYGILGHMERIPILIIDEIGQSDWATGTKKLSHLLDRRMGKWTLNISNLSQRDIASKLDVRIASRMSRGNNRTAVMSAECPDYDNLKK